MAVAEENAMLRVLLTNDDGIQSAGLRALAAQLSPRCEVLVVAPDTPQGAKSHSVTLHKPVRLDPVPAYVTGADPERLATYACSGTPADCVMLGALHLWKDRPPHLVLSGINDGENVAQDLSYSGTVGGAIEGVCCGVPAIALSSEGYLTVSPEDAAQAAELVLSILLYDRVPPHLTTLADAWRRNGEPDGDALWQIPPPAHTPEAAAYPVPADWYPPGLANLPCLNVNLPATPVLEIRGIRWTRAGHREYHDVVQPATDPRGRVYYWVAGDKVLLEDEHAGTDTHGLAHGYVTVTPMGYDRTNHEDLRRLRAWSLERG
jgi:5'-nucleotidase